MYQKSISIWKYIYKYYRNTYNWYLLGGDDMYIVMDNLYEYLHSDEIRLASSSERGMYIGLPFTNPLNIKTHGL